jgi:hypothetical protein
MVLVGALRCVAACTAYHWPSELRVFLAVATAFGVVALVAELIGLVTGSTVALAVLVAGMIALWLIATVRHAFTFRTEPGSGRDVHEVIHPQEAMPH